MLVKVRPGVYVNTEHVIRIARALSDQEHVSNENDWLLVQTRTESFSISAAAAAYLMEIMEVADAVVLPGEKDYVDYGQPSAVGGHSSQPLTSRVAQLLRDTLTQGANSAKIKEALDVAGSATPLIEAIGKLLTERVVVNISGLYYHALHSPRVFEAEKEIDLYVGVTIGEFKCISCEHVSCATCVAVKRCCQCKQPNFTPVLADCVTCGNPPSAPVHDPKFGNHLFGEGIAIDSILKTENSKLKTAKTIPDPLDASARLELSSLGEDNASLVSRNSSGLCDLCGYQRSSQIHLNSCAPLGVME